MKMKLNGLISPCILLVSLILLQLTINSGVSAKSLIKRNIDDGANRSGEDDVFDVISPDEQLDGSRLREDEAGISRHGSRGDEIVVEEVTTTAPSNGKSRADLSEDGEPRSEEIEEPATTLPPTLASRSGMDEDDENERSEAIPESRSDMAEDMDRRVDDIPASPHMSRSSIIDPDADQRSGARPGSRTGASEEADKSTTEPKSRSDMSDEEGSVRGDIEHESRADMEDGKTRGDIEPESRDGMGAEDLGKKEASRHSRTDYYIENDSRHSRNLDDETLMKMINKGYNSRSDMGGKDDEVKERSGARPGSRASMDEEGKSKDDVRSGMSEEEGHTRTGEKHHSSSDDESSVEGKGRSSRDGDDDDDDDYSNFSSMRSGSHEKSSDEEMGSKHSRTLRHEDLDERSGARPNSRRHGSRSGARPGSRSGARPNSRSGMSDEEGKGKSGARPDSRSGRHAGDDKDDEKTLKEIGSIMENGKSGVERKRAHHGKKSKSSRQKSDDQSSTTTTKPKANPESLKQSSPTIPATTTTEEPDVKKEPAVVDLKGMDPDKILAVVLTKNGNLIGRKPNAKVLAKIFETQLDDFRDHALSIKGDHLTVSTNNTFIFPAGTYYFPRSLRFAGFL